MDAAHSVQNLEWPVSYALPQLPVPDTAQTSPD